MQRVNQFISRETRPLDHVSDHDEVSSTDPFSQRRIKVRLPGAKKLNRFVNKAFTSVPILLESAAHNIPTIIFSPSKNLPGSISGESISSTSDHEDAQKPNYDGIATMKSVKYDGNISANDNINRPATRGSRSGSVASTSYLSTSTADVVYSFGSWTSQTSSNIYKVVSRNTVYSIGRDSGIGFSEEVKPLDDNLECAISDNPAGSLDLLYEFPREVIELIFSKLSPKDLMSCRQVCQSWKEVADSNAVWRSKYNQRSSDWKVKDPLPEGVIWKSVYKSRLFLDKSWKDGNVTPRILKGHTDSVYCVELDDTRIITGSRDKTIKIWNARNGTLMKSLEGSKVIKHTGSVLCLAFDTKILVSGSSDKSLIIWDIIKLRPIRRILRHKGNIFDICLNSAFIVSCSQDGSIYVWNRDDYSLRHKLSSMNCSINSIEFVAPKTVVSAGGDGQLKIWNIEHGICQHTMTCHDRGIACVAVYKNFIVSGGNDNLIKIWDSTTYKLLRTLKGHDLVVRSIHIVDDRIISGSYDQTIKVWDLNTGELLNNFTGWHSGRILSVKADHSLIVSTSMGYNPVVLDFLTNISDEIRYIQN